jgi:hypothetical protein
MKDLEKDTVKFLVAIGIALLFYLALTLLK